MAARPRKDGIAAHALSLMAPGQSYEPLANRMANAELEAARLHRLTPGQLESLDHWLSAHDKPTTR